MQPLRKAAPSRIVVIEDDIALLSDAVDLKDVLGQIEADGGNLHGVAPLSQF
mgnify:CR=1 FL=1